ADVGRRNVDVRPDEALELVHEAQRDLLQLFATEAARVELNAALTATEGHLADRRLPRHLGGERLEQVERDLAVVANAALVRPARLVVLHAVRLEARRLAGHQ